MIQYYVSKKSSKSRPKTLSNQFFCLSKEMTFHQFFTIQMEPSSNQLNYSVIALHHL